MTTKDDQEELNKWFKSNCKEVFKSCPTRDVTSTWLACCEYKNKEIAELKAWKEETLYHIPSIDENKASAQKEIAELKERIKQLERD